MQGRRCWETELVQTACEQDKRFCCIACKTVQLLDGVHRQWYHIASVGLYKPEMCVCHKRAGLSVVHQCKMDKCGTKRMWDHLEWWKTVEWFAGSTVQYRQMYLLIDVYEGRICVADAPWAALCQSAPVNIMTIIPVCDHKTYFGIYHETKDTMGITTSSVLTLLS